MSWKQVKVGDLVDQVRGVTYSSGDAIDLPKDGYVELLRANNIGNGSLNFEGLAYVPLSKVSDKQYLRQNDILIAASSGSISIVGKAASFNVNRTSTFGAFCKALRPNAKVDARYIANYFQTGVYRRTVSSLAEGANINNLRNEHIDNLDIALPPLAEQKRIAAILDKAAEIKAKREQAIAKLDELAQSTFVEMFGSPVNNRNWKNENLENLCTKITDGTHHSPNIEAEGVPYITAKHLKADGLDFFSKPWYVSKVAHDEIYKRCDPQKGDVLYIKDGATTGVAAINNYDFEFSMLSSLALIRVDKKRLNSTYLCYWLNNPIVKKNLLGFMSGAAIQRFTLAKIKKFSLPLPPIELQEEFERHINKIKLNRSKSSLALLTHEKINSSLQQKAFTTGFTA